MRSFREESLVQPLLMTELVCALAWALTGVGLALIVALIVGVAVVVIVLRSDEQPPHHRRRVR
jgi:Na+-driven multidrug efflux pump